MKSRWALVLFPLFFSIYSRSQDTPSPASLPPGHYIVVAAYLRGQSDFAKRFADKINVDGRHAKYGYDGMRSFYYVYLDYYADFNESIREMLKTRQQGGFPEAWVRVMKRTAPLEHTATATEPKKPEPVVAENRPQPAKETAPTMAADTAKVTAQPAFVPIEIVDNPHPDPVYRPQILTNTPVFLSLYNPTNNNVVEGEIEVIDTERGKLLTKVKGNDYVKLPDPKTKSGMLTLKSTSFGFRDVQHEINYKSTERDTLQPYVSLVGNYYMISFDMVRLHRGDIATLYNVYFYNDAAIMLPESKYELNRLLQMLKENPSCRIMLHGHTNGRAHGTLITRSDPNNYFQLTSDVKHGIGSAKDLSRQRAEVIRDWLITNGIKEDRMEIKAWGGARMIHDKNSANARKNVRVEVEVLQD